MNPQVNHQPSRWPIVIIMMALFLTLLVTCGLMSHVDYLVHEDELRARPQGTPIEGYIIWQMSVAGSDAFIISSTAMAKSVESEDSYSNNLLCEQGAMNGLAILVLPACERAAEIEPENAIYRDNRGIARLLTGRFEGVVEDIQNSLEWLKESASSNQAVQAKQQREQWLAALQNGEDPFESCRADDFTLFPYGGSHWDATPFVTGCHTSVIMLGELP